MPWIDPLTMPLPRQLGPFKKPNKSQLPAAPPRRVEAVVSQVDPPVEAVEAAEAEPSR